MLVGSEMILELWDALSEELDRVVLYGKKKSEPRLSEQMGRHT